MNIAFVNSTRIWSGVKTWMLEFGAELKALGDVPAYFGSDPRWIAEARSQGHPAEDLRFGFDGHPGTVAWFARRFRELRIDAACMNIQKELRTAGVAARLLGIPVVHRAGLTGDFSGKWDQRLTHRLIVNCVLVPCRTMREEIVARCPWIDAGAVRSIPNGKRVTGRPRPRKGSPVRLAITSRLDAPKRHQDLLEALAGPREEDGPALPDWRLDIFGDGQRKDALEALARQLGLERRVSFRGFARDLPARLPEYDFGLLTSENEGFPNTVLEYLAAGLPAIATDSGGTSEVLRHGQNGLLYAPGGVKALRSNLREALCLPDEAYAGWSAAAIDTMEREFNPASLAIDLHELFADLARDRFPA